MSDLIIKKNGTDYNLPMLAEHYPADRVYLDGDTSKTVQGAIDEVTTVEEVETGISGVTAYKCGKLVNLVFTCSTFTTSASQWNLIGNLPSELHPKTGILFLGFDNSITTSTVTLLPVQMRIKQNGEILWFSFNDKRECAPYGTVTYFTE